MKTHHYNIDLMVPMQTDKEILFNEAQVKIDSFCNASVRGFIAHAPDTAPVVGDKYILSAGTNSGYICYCANLSKGWQMLEPQIGMIIFVCEANSFFIFNNDNKWLKVIGANREDAAQYEAQATPNRFIGINGQFTIPATIGYIPLYLNDNCAINTEQVQCNQFTIILKQNYATLYTIEWSQNLMWQNKTPHQITKKANVMDIISFYRIVETQYFAAVVVAQGYSW